MRKELSHTIWREIIVIFILITSPSLCFGFTCKWDEKIINMLIVDTGLILIDWQQTLRFRRAGWKERNPVLGSEPTESEVNSKIMLGLGSLWISSCVFRKEYSQLILGTVLVMESAAVSINYQHGF